MHLTFEMAFFENTHFKTSTINEEGTLESTLKGESNVPKVISPVDLNAI